MTDTTNELGISNNISILGQILQTSAMIEYEKKMHQFNPFAALRLKDYEIRHTNALAWLLDSNGTHGLDDEFLLKFLEKVRIIASQRRIFPEHPSEFLPIDVKITAEDRFSENHPGKKPPNRLDIWLEGIDWAIALEAKIDSSEGENQLGRYSTEIDNRYKKRNQVKDTIFLYLTLDKSKPESESNPEAYANWNAVSWLGLVAESLVEALVATHGSIPVDDASYEQKFLLSYLDVIYEKSTREFEVAGTVSPSALEDKNMRDKYLENVRDLFHNPQNSKIKQFLIALKDEWEQYKAKRTQETRDDKKTKKTEKIGKIEFWEEFCDELKIREECENVTDFQSTLHFLLDQVDSTIEGRMRQIKDAIKAVSNDDEQVFEILSSSFYRINFIPKTWIGDKAVDGGKNRLRCLLEYKQEKGKIECKLYFLKAISPGGVIDGNYHAWRQQLWEQLIHDYEPVFVSKRLTQAEKTGYVAGLGDAKIINYEENIDKFLVDINAVLHDRFKPASALIYEANLKVTAPQS